MAKISEAELAAAYGLSPAEFEQVIDTVLGEARGEGFIGMAGVAKAMDNRANVRGETIYDVVTAPNQFDGASFQSGKKDAQAREVAIEALAAVAMGEDPAQVGTSDHFATNETKTGWTQAFSDTAKTVGGHTFYSSPEALELGEYLSVAATPQAKPDMAMQTAQMSIDNQGMPGVGIPNLSAMNAQTVNAVDPFAAVMNEQPQQQGDLRGRAASVAANAAITQPEGLLGYSFSPNTVRDQEIQPELAGIIGRATQAMGPEYAFSVTSGGQPAIGTSRDRVGSTRHDLGFAADGRLTVDGQGVTYAQDPELYAELAKQAGVQGAQGFGHYGWGVHIDNARPGAWGPDRTSATLSPAVRDAFNEGKAVREAGLYSQTGPTAKPDSFVSVSDLPGASLAPSRELSNYASFVGNNDALGRGTAPGRSYVDVDLDAFSVTDPFSQAVDRAAETRGGIGATPATAYGPSFGATDFAAAPAVTARDSMIDGYQEYAQSRGSGMAPLEAPQEIGVRAAEPAYTIDSIPGLDWATNQNNGPSLGTQATVATAPTSNVATPQGNQQQGGGPFGGFFDGGIGKGVKDTAMATAIGGPIAGGVVALDSVFGDGLSKDKDKDQEAKGRNAFGRARDAMSDFRGTTIGSGLTGVALGSNFGPGGALIGGALGLGRGFARNGMPSFGGFGIGQGFGPGTFGYESYASTPAGMAEIAAREQGRDYIEALYDFGGSLGTGRDSARDMARDQASRAAQGKPTWGDAVARDWGGLGIGKDKDNENENESEGKGGGCFLTTAAVDVLGEADNGDTLQTLRWFRDTIMRARPDWSADVDEYYRIAPAIVERLNGDEATYRDLMDKHIRPAVTAIKAGEYEKAYRVYRAMVEELS
jgi:hypothetical protein